MKTYGVTCYQFTVPVSVIDLTDETTEMESPSRPSTSADLRPLLDKQVTCPICKQLFSETYIEAHAANCDLHVETAYPAPSSTSTRYRQTTLVGRPFKRTTPPPPSESDSDNDDDNHEVCWINFSSVFTRSLVIHTSLTSSLMWLGISCCSTSHFVVLYGPRPGLIIHIMCSGMNILHVRVVEGVFI